MRREWPDQTRAGPHLLTSLSSDTTSSRFSDEGLLELRPEWPERVCPCEGLGGVFQRAEQQTQGPGSGPGGLGGTVVVAASEFYSKCSKEGFRSGDDMILWVSVIILLQCCHREKGRAGVGGGGGGGGCHGELGRWRQWVGEKHEVLADSGHEL